VRVSRSEIIRRLPEGEPERDRTKATSSRIPFNRPAVAGRELQYIEQAVQSRHLSGDGPFTRRCTACLESLTGAARALLTHSGTAALEMAALLGDVQPGDEVIMPSYTFVSTANAFVLRGATPVFVDIRDDTLNLDEHLVADAVTPRTRAIVPVHYAGVGCAMDDILAVSERHGLLVVEDAAQAVGASWHGRALGTIGDLGCLSFHETKNVVSGEGGALLINRDALVERAEIIREKGTNRSRFFRGQVDKYTWVDVGSSYLPSDLLAAFLLAQLEYAADLRAARLGLWGHYHEAFESYERRGLVRRPVVPDDCEQNGHMYYLRLPSLEARTAFIAALVAQGINPVFHYIPLHSSPAGRKVGRAFGGELPVTDRVSDTLVRLPLWPELGDGAERVIDVATHWLDARDGTG
jgi:dTDP-4-amino-4,6-dideoxygalactose transaminase